MTEPALNYRISWWKPAEKVGYLTPCERDDDAVCKAEIEIGHSKGIKKIDILSEDLTKPHLLRYRVEEIERLAMAAFDQGCGAQAAFIRRAIRV